MSKKYNSVLGMLKDTCDDLKFIKEFEKLIIRKKISKAVFCFYYKIKSLIVSFMSI
jgi:hypothetical protein